ncbi:MAG: hypothetical protein OXU74_04705 [Gemmatimonadota bacterium]|nr:hypothetical protein [Gemmatimonadota bacterium]
MRFWKGLAGRDARTSPDSDDPALVGRTYAIPFGTVWDAIVALASGGLKGWKLARWDDHIGLVAADVTSWPIPLAATVLISVKLDANGQTRVDMSIRNVAEEGRLPINQRRIDHFFRALDRSLAVRPDQVLVAGPATAPIIALVTACTLALACDSGSPDVAVTDTADPSAGPVAAETTPETAAPTAYQRTVVFVDTERDTTVFVSWDFENLTLADSTRRTLRGWVGRGAQWILLAEEAWATVPSRRAPWRIVPRGDTRMIVEQDDVLREIYYQAGVRDVSVRIGDAVIEWIDSRGGRYRLLDGVARLGAEERSGWVMDVSGARTGSASGSSEWGLLVGDDQLKLLLSNADGSGEYRAWARMGTEERFWPSVSVSWGETRSFERARRDIPVLWRFRSSDGSLRGEFQSVSAHHLTLDANSPILPVLGVYEVEGMVSTDDNRVAVKGFLRHQQR